tara:strand:- start:699 stop:1373 length:675 start_codon:yes stop_codon:yes gene_type:complete
MSLIATASNWNNDESSNKKRIPSIRKTVKLKPQEHINEYNSESKIPTNIENFKSSSDERSSRVTELLDKITSLDTQDDKMGDFKPISPPEINVNSDYNTVQNNNIHVPPLPKFNTGSAASNILGDIKYNYGANDTHTANLSNYSKSYEPPKSNINEPYYAKMGISSSNGDSQLMEKINYMIHLLEEQQNEKTENITEEFLLYTFLGVFVIFVVDSFARAGKYTR